MQKLLLYICLLFICTQCAQITPLGGGKRDATPPKAEYYNPENASLHFNSSKIEITFNEYIGLKDITNQFIITPQTKQFPEIETSGKKLKIKFNEALMPNTTYKLSFGSAIIDLHEGNVIENFEYYFSTGNNIDSLTLSGQVLNAINKKPEPQLLIGLYDKNANDSIIYKEKPLYIAKTNNDGNFNFSYLPNNEFKLVAIKDANKNLMYDGSDEQIAYEVKNVSTFKKDTLTKPLLLFKELPSKRFIKSGISLEYGKAQVIYNKPQAKIKTVKANGLNLNYYINENNDTLSLYYNDIVDTLKAIVEFENSKIDTFKIKIASILGLEKIKKMDGLKYIVNTNILAQLPHYELPRLHFNFPIKQSNINTSKIIFYVLKDSIKVNVPFEILKTDNTETNYELKAELQQEQFYTLTFNKNAFKDPLIDRTSDSTTIKFTTTHADDYAQLNLKLMFPKKENYIVMLLNEKEVVVKKTIVEFALTSSAEKIIEYKNLMAGNYFVRVVEDVNKNNAFDMGNYFLKQQPETIFINSLPIKLLAGWEIENEWLVK